MVLFQCTHGSLPHTEKKKMMCVHRLRPLWKQHHWRTLTELCWNTQALLHCLHWSPANTTEQQVFHMVAALCVKPATLIFSCIYIFNIAAFSSLKSCQSASCRFFHWTLLNTTTKHHDCISCNSCQIWTRETHFEEDEHFVIIQYSYVVYSQFANMSQK